MKKCILAVILIISAVFCAFGQNSDTIDLVLLLDTSSAMGASYEKVNEYITGAFLSEFLRIGDTFHLITFSASPRLDIARRISARGDIETIIGRMLIQYPVETGNNASAAVNYAETYISTLPPRPKKIVLVSSGGTEINNIVSAAKQRLSSKNATLDFVSVTGDQPIANLPSSGRSSSSRQTASSGTASGTTAAGAASTRATGTSASAGTAPAQGASGTQSTTQGSSQTGTQPAATQGSSQTGTQTAAQGTSQTGTQSTTQPSTSDTTPAAQGVSPSDDRAISETSRDTPRQDSTSKDSTSAARTDTAKRDYSGSFNPTLPLIIGIIAALLLLILLIVFVSRRLGSSPNRVMASVSAFSNEKEDRFKDHSRDLASYAASQSKKRITPYSDRPVQQHVVVQPTINPAGPLLLNLFVEDQNTAIGKRNIHSLKSGYSLSVGGGKSDDFYIFLVPLPSHLGEIRRSGSQLTFIPRKPKYFPDIGANEVRDCINKRIRIISDKNYEMWFSFVMYEDPLIALNRVLHSIKVPG